MKFYWGEGAPGNVEREEWLVPARLLKKWSKRAELALFTGRTRKELSYTLDRLKMEKYFKQIVTMDDIKNLKPHPDGLFRILNGRDPSRALYLGDNIDDALASQRAQVPFLGVLPRGSHARKMRGHVLRELGALSILHEASELDGWLATNRRN